MAVFSLHHSAIGRTTHDAYAAVAHAKYITRERACTKLIGALPPGYDLDKKGVVQWLTDGERSDRSNARVCDKITLALPIELSREDRAKLVSDFVRTVSQGRIAWVAAIHDGGDDANNPHAHLILRDRDFETGRRVILTTECRKGRKSKIVGPGTSTQMFRIQWAEVANAALTCAGHPRISAQPLKAQGIPQIPQIHCGAKVEALEAKGIRTVRGDMARAIKTANGEIAELLELNRQLLEQQSLLGKIKARIGRLLSSMRRGSLKPDVPAASETVSAAPLRVHLTGVATPLTDLIEQKLIERAALEKRRLILKEAERTRLRALDEELTALVTHLKGVRLRGSLSPEERRLLTLLDNARARIR